ncbi:MAG: STAS domain-containing protein [Alphaproteobacteria bacterium]|nr:STAS domain-containing protein [Alphaproteobacteria bacterium]
MGFDYHIDDDKVTMTLNGEIDLQVTGELKAYIDQCRHITHLDIVAGGVTYMDSSGVAVLLYARQMALNGGFSFTISTISSSVFRILEVARLDTILPIGHVIKSSDSSTDAFGLSLPSDANLEANPEPEPEPKLEPEAEHVVADLIANPNENIDVEAAISADLAAQTTTHEQADVQMSHGEEIGANPTQPPPQPPPQPQPPSQPPSQPPPSPLPPSQPPHPEPPNRHLDTSLAPPKEGEDKDYSDHFKPGNFS